MIFSIEEHTKLMEALHQGSVDVTFTKKDGTQRTMVCTLNKTLIPAEFIKEDYQSTQSEDQTNCPVFDLEKQNWRSFRYSSIKSFSVTGD